MVPWHLHSLSCPTRRPSSEEEQASTASKAQLLLTTTVNNKCGTDPPVSQDPWMCEPEPKLDAGVPVFRPVWNSSKVAHMSESPLIGRKILVVEDEPMIVMLIESLLEELGCVVADVAARPAPALGIIDTTEIDAAILDVNLNGDDSFGIATVLADRRIPFVFATGYGGSRLPPQFADRPVLQKPYRIEELAEALEAAFGRPAAPM